MTETRKIAAILAADVVGFSRMASADEDRTLARLRALRADLLDPTIAGQNGHVFKRTGDGALVEFRSVVEAVRCAITVQNAMIERNVGMPADQRIEFRIGIHLGDVVEESDGDLMGDGVNIAARLEGIASPGAICLSEHAYWQVKGRLDLAVTDLGPMKLKNIAEPVRAYSLQVGMPTVAKAATEANQVVPATLKKRHASAALALVGIVLLIAVAAGAWHYIGSSRVATGAPARSLVVLPLTNLSGDAAQEYIVDALTDELTTSISRLPGMFVIARNTAFTFKGKPTDAKSIGSELGVKYVLEGSVQPTENRMRVNAQLIDAESGAHLWAESFDENRADLLQMEDDIVARLARTLDVAMDAVEATKAGRIRPSNPDAQDLALRCSARFWDYFAEAQDPVKHPEIYEMCAQALRVDPGNTRALKVLTWRLAKLPSLGVDIATELERLDELAQKALARNPNDADARNAHGNIELIQGRLNEVIAEFERAIALNPSDIAAYGALLFAYFASGQEEKALAVADKAMRLSPRDPSVLFLLIFKAMAFSALGRDGEAEGLLDQALTLAPNNWTTLRYQAATLANLGRETEAREVYQRYSVLAGGQMATVAQYRAFITRLTANVPIMAAWRERMFAGLRKAGMPEE